MSKIKVYIANLGKYNEGELVGKWLELPIDMSDEWEEFKQSIQIDGEEYEEWAIHDYEAPEGIKIDENDNIEELNELAEQMEELDEHDEKKLLALIEWGYYSDVKEAVENIENFVLYEDINTEEELGDYYIEEGLMGDIPDNIKFYIDTEKLGRDISIEAEGCFTKYGWITA